MGGDVAQRGNAVFRRIDMHARNTDQAVILPDPVIITDVEHILAEPGFGISYGIEFQQLIKQLSEYVRLRFEGYKLVQKDSRDWMDYQLEKQVLGELNETNHIKDKLN